MSTAAKCEEISTKMFIAYADYRSHSTQRPIMSNRPHNKTPGINNWDVIVSYNLYIMQ